MLLDIHTHHLAQAAKGRAIYSLDLRTDSVPPSCFCSLSIHPWTLTAEEAPRLLKLLEQAASDKNVLAIGEAGLDKLRGIALEEQMRLFAQAARLAEQLRLPLIIHCVKATAELLAIRKALSPRMPWILHGFRGKPEQAIDLTTRHDFYLSFGFRHSPQALRAIAPERICLESDESCQPIGSLIGSIAAERGWTARQLIRQLQANYRHLFPALPQTP